VADAPHEPGSRPTLRNMWKVVGVWALSPVVAALTLFVLTPTYFRPMVYNGLGVAMLGVAAALTVLGVVLGMMSLTAIWERKTRLAWILLVLQSVLCFLPTILILLLGPAALILIHART
jgi:hypothetical protein